MKESLNRPKRIGTPRNFMLTGLTALGLSACIGDDASVGSATAATESQSSTGTTGVESESEATTSTSTETSTESTTSTTTGLESSTVTTEWTTSSTTEDPTGSSSTGEKRCYDYTYCNSLEGLECGDDSDEKLKVKEVISAALNLSDPRNLDLYVPDNDVDAEEQNYLKAAYLRMIVEEIDGDEPACLSWSMQVMSRAKHLSPEQWGPLHLLGAKPYAFEVEVGAVDVVLAEYELGGTDLVKFGQLTNIISSPEGEFGDSSDVHPPLHNIRMRCIENGVEFTSDPVEFEEGKGSAFFNPPKVMNTNYPEPLSLPCQLIGDIDVDAIPGTVVRAGVSDYLPGSYVPIFGVYDANKILLK